MFNSINIVTKYLKSSTIRNLIYLLLTVVLGEAAISMEQVNTLVENGEVVFSAVQAILGVLFSVNIVRGRAKAAGPIR